MGPNPNGPLRRLRSSYEKIPRFFRGPGGPVGPVGDFLDKWDTPPKFNIAPENRESQKETQLPGGIWGIIKPTDQILCKWSDMGPFP